MKQPKHFVLFSFLFLLSFPGFYQAQQKMLTVEDVINSYYTLRPASLQQLSWIPDRNDFSYVKSDESGTYLFKQNVDSKEPSSITSLEDLNSKLKLQSKNELAAFPSIEWIGEHSFKFWNKSELYVFDCINFEPHAILSIDEQADNIELAGDNNAAAYTICNNLFVTTQGGVTKQITKDDNPGIVNGQAVHRNEFGINKGIFWSPNSKFIAFYRMDETMVTDYPIVNITPRPAQLEPIKYPMAGQTSHQVTVGIYEIANGKTTWLKTGEPLDQYLTCLTWDPSEKYFYIAHLNRDQNHLQLVKYDAVTGERIKILFEETDNEYVEPEHSLIFLSNDENKFLWFSKRDGWNHLYLYTTDGQLIKQVTNGQWDVISFEGFDHENEKFFFVSNKDYIPGRDFYIANIDNGWIKKITTGEGTHTVKANSEGSYFIDQFNNFTTPNTIKLVDVKSKDIKTIFTADDPLADYTLGEIKIFTLQTEDKIDLYCRLIYPTDFDSSKKYPVIVYVYGGPHSQGVINNYPFGRYDLWFHMMAEKGFIVFEMDNRGTTNRGLEFEQTTFRRLGTIEVHDQMIGVNYLKSLSYVDTSRFGVYGWSYGGFMATSLMLRTNNTFKVGVGGGSVIDWKYYEVMYGERYMDTPETNPDGYIESSLLNYVQNLNGKLLLVNGTSDPTVLWQNSLDFIKKAVSLNKPLDYFPYVGHGHGVRGKDAIHLYNKLTNYFLENL
ncbi:MAG: DPP IV N-terminal domain-containing protein [bacterium]